MGASHSQPNELSRPVGARPLLARIASFFGFRRAGQADAEKLRELERANDTLREARDALASAEKMAAISTMAAGLAHEMNNPLSFMKAGATAIRSLLKEADQVSRTALAERPEALDEVRTALAEIGEVAGEVAEGALRLQNILVALQTFSTDTAEEPEEVDLRFEVDHAWTLAAERVQGNVRLELPGGPMPPLVTAPHLFGQVLFHVLVNAREANRGEGTISISVERQGDEVRLAIRDEGPGFPAEHLRRVFDPFFTTKQPGQGLGLGLTMSYGIMRGLGGRIEVATAPGGGAVVTLALPLRPGGPSYDRLRST